jgi:hypothetical protein
VLDHGRSVSDAAKLDNLMVWMPWQLEPFCTRTQKVIHDTMGSRNLTLSEFMAFLEILLMIEEYLPSMQWGMLIDKWIDSHQF